MQEKQPRQYGLWPSAVSPKSMATGKKFVDLAWDQDEHTLVWLESRSGQGTLFAIDADQTDAPRDLTGDLNVRAHVGYGGGDFTVAHGFAYFADGASGRLLRVRVAGGAPSPVTPPFGSAAAPRVTPDGRFVAYVHHDQARTDRLAVVDAQGRYWPQILAEGHDFYAWVRWSPDGRRLAFVAWDHPNMPWEGCRLYLASVNIPHGSGLPTLAPPKLIAGGSQVSIFQPEFTPDGRSLLYVSDESGFGQLHALDLNSGKSTKLTSTQGAEYGQPAWTQEQRSYAVLGNGEIVAAVNKRGFVRLHALMTDAFEAELLDPLSVYTDVAQPVAQGSRLAFFGSSPTVSQRLVVHDFAKDKSRIVARQGPDMLAEGDLAHAVALTWRSAGLEEAHGLFYAPANSRYSGIGRPPLIVIIHGGPTAQARAGFKMEAQFFASRGYAVLYVNHRGSSGYGREYMLKLRGKWGQVDVEDAVSGARHLVDAGKVDPGRMVIMGGSAGGYTVLQTLVDEPEAFQAGIVEYGIANQFTLVADTHKFEERYSDFLLGPLPDTAKLYRQRSPLFHAAKIRRPLALFQGAKDQVVPPSQAESIVKALQRAGTPHIYHLYEGEGHGFRKAETLEHFYTTVDAFLREHVIYR